MKSLISMFVITMLVVFAGCTEEKQSEISNFEECVEAGNPIMESYPRKCQSDGKTFTEELSNKEVCENLGAGEWLEEHKECEGISKELCEQYNGTFNQCGSACRHEPDSDMCIEVCVPYCKFN